MSFSITIAALIICMMMHIILHQFSKKIGLIGVPGGRKIHEGSIPLIGGLAIYLTCIAIETLFTLGETSSFYIILLLPIVLIGFLDDIFDISAKFRLVFQFAISSFAVFFLDLNISILNMFLSGQSETFLAIYILEKIVTIFFIVTLMNAINMIDGIDGFSGLTLLFSLLAVSYIQTKSSHGSINPLIPVIIPSLIIFLYFNILRKPEKKLGKVFMGDSGTMFLGFFLAICLINASQNIRDYEANSFVHLLWFVFLPLSDIFSTLISRLMRGKSPFNPDRTHIHHILLRSKVTKNKTLQLLVGAHLSFIAFGFWLLHTNINELMLTLITIIAFVIYRILLSQAPKFMRMHIRYLRSKSQSKNGYITSKNISDRLSI